MAVGTIQYISPNDFQVERTLGYEPGMGLVQPLQYSTAGVNTSYLLPGGIRGVAFSKVTLGQTGTNGAAAGVQSGIQTLGAQFIVVIPSNGTLTTGLQFQVLATDDGTNAADLGLVAEMGIQCKVLAASAYTNLGVSTASTTTFIQAGSGAGANLVGAETAFSVTLGATSSFYVTTTASVTTANLGTSAAVGSVILCRLRRIGSNTSDTLAGRLVVLGVSVLTY